MAGIGGQFRLIGRYVLAGLTNTAVGLGLTLVLDVGFHLAPALANAAGYAVGVMVAYVLNRGFVFRHRGAARVTSPRFLAAVAIGFGLNQLVLALASRMLHGGSWRHAAAQILAAGCYSVSVYLMCRYWVFRTSAA
jgi:putative flippase GtrA